MIITIVVIALFSTITYVAISAYNKIMFPPKTLFIIRGLPGSGKTTYATGVSHEKGISHYETDMYLTNDHGVYDWTEEKLVKAIDLCLDNVEYEMSIGANVIVSGCFLRWCAIRPYVELATAHGYEVDITQCMGEFQNVHDVPADKLARMRDRFIANESLPNAPGIVYSTHIPEAV